MAGCCGGDDAVSPNKDGEPESIEMSADSKRKYEKNFRGPMHKRSCTDIICLLLFLICIGGLAVVSFFAFTQGDINVLLYPTDSQGKFCGQGDYESKSKLLFFDMLACARSGAAAVLQFGCPTPQVCVKACPSSNWVWLTLAAEETAKGVNITRRSEQLVCVDESYKNKDLSIHHLVTKEICAPYLLNSKAFAGRCVPTIFVDAVSDLAKLGDIKTNANETIVGADNSTVTYKAMSEASKILAQILSALGVAQNAFNDVNTAWYLILIGISIGAVVAFIWCVLVRFAAGCLVFGTLIIFFIAFGGATAYCALQYRNSTQTISSLGNDFFTTNYSTYLAIKETWLVLGILSGVCFLIVFIVLVCLRNRLRLAIGIIKQASKAVAAIAFSLIFPIYPFVMQLVVIGYIATNTVFLAATGKQINTTDLCNSTSSSDQLGCQFVKYGRSEWSFYLQAYNLFMGFWLTCFVVGFNQLVLAGTFASWYWAWEKPKDVPNYPIIASFWRTFRYHLGTVAFGSLIIAIVKFIRAMLMYVESKLKGKDNCGVKFLLCCLKCCFWCLEKCLKFLTKNAYIITAIYGRSFCFAAKDAFFLILRNCLRVAVVDNVTSFVFFVGKLLVTGIVTAAAFFFFDGRITALSSFNPTLNYFFVPVIVIAIGTFIVATIFFSVFTFAVDTLFVCVMEDLERNNGTQEKPYFMSKGLMKILDVDNKFKDDPENRDSGCCCC